VRSRGWLFFLAASVALAISAAYELFEWAGALTLGQSADAFLGTQGDPWDTQWDMFLALIGALLAQLLLGRMHDRHLAAAGGA
jgi:putative membrane protein